LARYLQTAKPKCQNRKFRFFPKLSVSNRKFRFQTESFGLFQPKIILISFWAFRHNFDLILTRS
jgi:hypothetical protein